MPGLGSDRFGTAHHLVTEALVRQLFPAATVEVGTVTSPIWREAFGRLTFDDGAPPTTLDTVFDLASLTKVLATAPLVLDQVETGALNLDDAVGHHVPRWGGTDRDAVTLRDLLSHSAGLPAHAPLYQSCQDGPAFERAICDVPLAYAPGSTAVYSDLGFILLGQILSRREPLTHLFDQLVTRMKVSESLRFLPPIDWRPLTAPTGNDDWRSRLLVAEVHDRNAWALGGAAGHAGLFGTAAAVGNYARHLLAILAGSAGAFDRDSLVTFTTRREGVPGSSRALGWDTMLPTSSSGGQMSPRAFGHTGFTGTSLWIDPDLGVYVVLLTNRVYPTPTGEGLKAFRPAFHDAIMEAIDANRSGQPGS
jgi:CubicO group peptidase (beta-lactamase class C family)